MSDVTTSRSIFVIHSNFFLHNNAISEVPINVAVQYNHRSVHTPDSNAGANERAGFIDVPDIKAKSKISNPTIPPITIPLNAFKPFVNYSQYYRHQKS
jgi:hypothetical protein